MLGDELISYNFISNKTRFLVTGGAGFIGSTFVKRLLLNTEAEVFNIDKIGYASDLSSIDQVLNSGKCLKPNKYKFLKADITNFSQLRKVIEISNPDYVINFAAESHVDRSIEEPKAFIENNIIGTFNLLEILKSHFSKLSNERQKSFRFHHISTDEVFGSLGKEGYFSESSIYDPRSPYSASKASSDHLVTAWHHTYGLPTLITNCSNNYGPWQFTEKLIPLVIIRALQGKSIPLYGDGSNIRDWLFVEDHIDAIFSVLGKGKIGHKYCIGGFGEKTNKEVVNLICIYLDQVLPKENSYGELIKSVRDRPSHDKRYAIDSQKIRNEIGWNPQFTFEEGLKKTINWYITNQRWCAEMKSKSGYNCERLG